MHEHEVIREIGWCRQFAALLEWLADKLDVECAEVLLQESNIFSLDVGKVDNTVLSMQYSKASFQDRYECSEDTERRF